MAAYPQFPGDAAMDVLLVGAGPAGYMAAVTLARYGVNFRMIDQRAETIQGGQAGGESLPVFMCLGCHQVCGGKTPSRTVGKLSYCCLGDGSPTKGHVL